MTTMLFRRAVADDLPAIHQLATNSGVIGLTTLPKDIHLLKERLDWSVNSFKENVTSPNNEYYLFVLEEPTSQKIIGTSAIQSSVGFDTPFYSYKVSKRTRICHDLDIRNDYKVLSPVNDNQGSSEICTLFLDPTYRKQHNGLLLSLARFLFIAQYPQRFSPTIIAEMRGISDEEGHSPFWDQIGAHFFHMSFAEADRLTISTNKQFIADLMPRNLIYVPLLSPAAQAVIGQPHESTLPAMTILLREGFHYNNYVDIFDAGPIIEASRDSIKTATTSNVVTIENIVNELSSKPFLIANTSLDFSATVSQAIINNEQTACTLDRLTSELLGVKCGDSVRISPLQTNHNP
jgi:arginine N-succinyltransferase